MSAAPVPDAELADIGYRRPRSDALKVRYAVDGTTYQVEVPGDVGGREPRDRIEVSTTPTIRVTPDRRRAGPAYEFLLLVAAVLALATPALWFYDRHQVLQPVRAVESGDAETMWAVTRRCWSLGPTRLPAHGGALAERDRFGSGAAGHLETVAPGGCRGRVSV